MKNRGMFVALVAVLIVVAAGYLFYRASRPATRTTETSEMASGAAVVEVKTAAAHASFASEGSSVSYIREHLGHVILCLEGPRGANVNAAWDNPCQGAGNGVLNDLGSAGASWMPVVQTADDLAVKALRSSNLAGMKLAAQGVAALLKLVADAF